MADARTWAALTIESLDAEPQTTVADALTLLLDDWGVVAIEDLEPMPLPANGLWDPAVALAAEPPPARVRWRVFFDRTSDRDGAQAAISAALPLLSLSPADVPDDDWAARSQRALTAIRAGAFIVAPPWDVPADCEGARLVIIEPSMGFGTGHHATTRLCLQALSSIDVRGKRVLDIGTGSGVLAIGASLCGAACSVGVDVDPDAIGAAVTSAALNSVAGPLSFEVADFRSRSDLTGDIVLANLTGGLLMRAADALLAIVAPGGTLIVSGLDAGEEAGVRAALGPGVFEHREEEDGWVCLVLKPAPPEPA